MEIELSTGIPALDDMLHGVELGDNIVWQVESIEVYIPFVHAFCKDALYKKKQLIYFRFADHQSIVPENSEIVTYKIDPKQGFEPFLGTILGVIEEYGKGVNYIFDCLSDLAVDWYSDVMLANFFRLTCPYLYDYDTATYFALLRNHNASHAIKEIHNTAQVIIDVYQSGSYLYIHPLKVFERYSSTMYMLHKWIPDEKGRQFDQFCPVLDSVTSSRILTQTEQPWLDYTLKQNDVWSTNFNSARKILADIQKGTLPKEWGEKWKRRILRMAITRDEKRNLLAEKYLRLEDLINIGKRMIGTGLIGGKSVGMLLAQAILRKENPSSIERLEPHDSYFIGSDVYYTFLVENKCWWDRRRITQQHTFMEGIEAIKEKILKGKFPRFILNQFREMLDYFGQSPIIVRSSSLLEDAYGNSFSGKYESVFCANQGNHKERLFAFLNAVRVVYASTIDIEALTYRKDRGLLDKDEEMALLVQRVSGEKQGPYYFPHIAGVGYSFNPYCWNPKLDPNAGVLRMVFGLGTRAVDRTSDDYTHLVGLNMPELRLDSSSDERRKYSQKQLDLIDLNHDRFHFVELQELYQSLPEFHFEWFASWDNELESIMARLNREDMLPWVMDFENLLENTDFPQTISQYLKILQTAYSHPVDIEYTVNFLERDRYYINLLQCRPFQIQINSKNLPELGEIEDEDLIFKTNGPIVGNSIATKVDVIIYIKSQEYSQLAEQDKYMLARIIGEITHYPGFVGKKIMLLGPGRWGTTTPSLGVPVSFSEINTVSIICEIAEMHEGLIPDISLGTHFFNDLVELNMAYFAIYPNRKGTVIKREFFEYYPNNIEQILIEGQKWAKIIKICDFTDTQALSQLKQQPPLISLYLNSLTQQGLCFIKKG